LARLRHEEIQDSKGSRGDCAQKQEANVEVEMIDDGSGGGLNLLRHEQLMPHHGNRGARL
jgi:hypothetical protein